MIAQVLARGREELFKDEREREQARAGIEAKGPFLRPLRVRYGPLV
jgi:hypothetical protein